jgi:hypothetical protein
MKNHQSILEKISLNAKPPCGELRRGKSGGLRSSIE